MGTCRRTHWNDVYGGKHYTDVSWYQDIPATSLELIASTGIARDDAIIDVGGGASTLIDCLVDRGYTNVSVLDISGGAIAQAKTRLGARAARVQWIEADVTAFEPERSYALWHDRAALHFLVDERDRTRYVDTLRKSLRPGGHLVLATFGPDGPLKCSGLEIRRYNIDMTRNLLGDGFELRDHGMEEHRTPAGAMQQFLCSVWTRSS